ncbi:hypothetical protein TIFTF001_037011 [Ficus carica]|uniref:Uncharacterized protein n=1 Tax=Ficus carica TaxID=3494 RepID=A0AA88E937_FICCA|nr:hypothetical protein TIFTF001_037011 [Ficus carica]
MKQKDSDIEELVACVVSEYEKATLKARYELLKEYKQGLFVYVNVEEEIELYEESNPEAGAPISTPSTSVKHLVTTASTDANEIKPPAIEPFTSEGHIDDPLESKKVVDY